MEFVLEARKGADPQDAGFVSKARDGDTAAFKQLYRRNVGRIYATCLRISADVTLAEDLTQRTFIRAWQMLKTFRGESTFSSWLHRIAVNVVLVEFRTEKRRRDRIEFSDTMDDYDGP